MKKKRFVYLIQDLSSGFTKIGISTTPKKRLKALQTGNSSELSIIYEQEVFYPSKVENALHHQFGLNRIHNEWFDLSEQDVEIIKTQIGKIEESFLILERGENPFL